MAPDPDNPLERAVWIRPILDWVSFPEEDYLELGNKLGSWRAAGEVVLLMVATECGKDACKWKNVYQHDPRNGGRFGPRVRRGLMAI